MVVHDVSTCRPPDRFELWREVICKAFTPLTPDPSTVGKSGFEASVELRPFGSTNRAVLGSVPQRIAHGAREVAQTGQGVFFVNMQLAGRCRVRTESAGTVDVLPGQLSLVDTTRPYWFDYDGPWRAMSFQVPHSSLSQPDMSASQSIGRPIDAGSGIGLVVASVMKALWVHDADDARLSVAGPHLEKSFFSTVEAVLAESWSDVPDWSNSIRTAADEYIRTHLHDPSLSVPMVARALSVSTRTVHYAFATGESFTSVVRSQRLEAIAAVLRDRKNTNSISRIAVHHGMIDASSFGRAFRRHFSMSARQYRARAQSAQYLALEVETGA